MRYNWTKKDLIDEKKKLSTFIDLEQNYDRRKYMELILEKLNDYIESFNKKIVGEELDYNAKLATINYEIITLGAHYSLVDRFFDTTNKFIDSVDFLEEQLEVLEKSKFRNTLTGVAKISKDRTMTLTDQFYRSFAPNLYPTFAHAFDQRYSSVRFKNFIRNNVEADSIYYDVIDRYFINIENTNTISKVYNSIHEYGHVIAGIINPKSRVLPKYELFSEVESLFPEMVSKYQNIGNFDEFSVLMSSYAELVSYIGYATNITCHKPFINLWKEHNCNAGKEYFKDIEEYYDLDQEMADSVFDTNVSSEGDYVVSYLVAIELFELYKKDKNKSLQIFEEFLRLPYTENAQCFFESKLNLGSSLEEYAGTLIEKVDRKLQKVVS